MTNKEKLEFLKTWLKEHNIPFQCDVAYKAGRVTIPLWIPRYRVAVRILDDDHWFLALRRFVYPVFIRDEDTADFVLTKVSNTIDRYKDVQSRLSSHTPSQRKGVVLRRRHRELAAFRKQLLDGSSPASSVAATSVQRMRKRKRIVTVKVPQV